MKKDREYKLSENFLIEYQDAALSNSQALIEEALLLFNNHHCARAYFLAAASTEETGKAYHAFSARGRNLRNPAIQSKIKKLFENHQAKFVGAMAWLMLGEKFDPKRVEYLFDVFANLRVGREKSMYADVVLNNNVTLPNNIVRKEAASSAIRLASDCLRAAKEFVKQSHPLKVTAIQDKFFTINSNVLTKIFGSEDFRYYLIEHIKSTNTLDYIPLTVKYYDRYYSKRKTYRQNPIMTEEGNS